MKKRTNHFRSLITTLVLITPFLLSSLPSQFVSAAALADSFQWPIDDGPPTIVMPYGVTGVGTGNEPSMYHAGEDWMVLRDTVVRAVANGRVTFLSRNREEGSGPPWKGYPADVIVIEHQTTDGYIYSQYGHIVVSVSITNGSSVTKGQEIGRVWDWPRNNSHLHWEIRTQADETSPDYNNGNYYPPGAGYTMTLDQLVRSGYLNPSAYIRNHMVPIASSTSIGLGSTQGNISSPTDANQYSFSAQAGTQYTIEVRLGTLTDSVLTLQDASGNTIAENDDAGGALGYGSRIVWTSTANGDYVIRVRSWNQSSQSGSYTLTLANGQNQSVQQGNPSSTTPTVILTASSTSTSVGNTVTLTATASQDVGPTPYYIVIRDQTMNTRPSGPEGRGSTLTYSVTGNSATTHTFFATIEDSGGAIQNRSSAIDITWTITGGQRPQTSSLTGWQQQDIGNPLTGSATNSGGTFVVRGSGDDIWNNADAFHFVYQSLNGDGQIIARVASIENTDGWAKAGVMFRESLSATSKQAMVVVTPSNGVAFQHRASTGGQSVHTPGSSSTTPRWIKLIRSGNTFSAYESFDGSSWTSVGSETISMGNSIYIGLAVTSHNSAAISSASIDNVVLGVNRNSSPTVTQQPNPPPTTSNPPPTINTPSTQSLQDFVARYTGVKVGDTTENFGECVGLVEVWIDTLGLPHVWGNALDLLGNANPSYYTIVYNNPDDTNQFPVPGDIMVWGSSWGGGYGHAGIVINANGWTFSSFEQNNPVGHAPQIVAHSNYAGVLGWLHPPTTSQPPAAPQPPQSTTYAIPQLQAPNDGISLQVNQTITFSWSNTGASQYKLEIWNDTGSGSLSTMINSTSTQYAPPYAGSWRWQVRSVSSNGQPGDAPHTRSFTVSSPQTTTQPPVTPQPPQSTTYAIPQLQAPNDGISLQVNQTITFSWSNTGAPQYKIEAWNDTGSGSLSTIVTGTSTQFAPGSSGSWRWQVRSVLPNGQPGDAPHTRSFRVGTSTSAAPSGTEQPSYEPSFAGQTVSWKGNTFRSDDGRTWTFKWRDGSQPIGTTAGPFRIQSPPDNVSFPINQVPMFVWEATVDDQGNPVTYVLKIDGINPPELEAAKGAQRNLRFSGLTVPYFTPPSSVFREGLRYGWQVEAVSITNATRVSDGSGVFTVLPAR